MKAEEQTYGNFLAYLKQVVRLKRIEAGQPADEVKKPAMTTEDFIESVLSGDFVPQLGPEETKVRTLSPEQQKREEMKLMKLLGLDPNGNRMQNLPPQQPTFYGSNVMPKLVGV